MAEAKVRFNDRQLAAWSIVSRSDERLIGSTGFGEVSTEDSCLGNGWTWLVPAARGGHTTAEVKFLQLTWAFEAVGASRVAFKADRPRDRFQPSWPSRESRGRLDLDDQVVSRPTRQNAPFFIKADEWVALRPALSARLEISGCGS
jgi:hypothetical protein